MTTKQEQKLFEIFEQNVAQLDPVKPEDLIILGGKEKKPKKQKKNLNSQQEQVSKNIVKRGDIYKENQENQENQENKQTNNSLSSQNNTNTNNNFSYNYNQPVCSTDDSSNNRQSDKVILENNFYANNDDDFQENQVQQKLNQNSGQPLILDKSNQQQIVSDQNDKNVEKKAQNSIDNNDDAIQGQYNYNYNLQKQRMEQKIKKAQQKKKEIDIQNQQQQKRENQDFDNQFEGDLKQNQKTSISKNDFKFDKYNKVTNILNEEEEIGEVGEMIERTANQRFQRKQSDQSDLDSEDQQKQQNEDDEFEKAFEDGKKGIIAAVSTNRQQQEKDQDFFNIETEASKARKEIQEKANQKLKGKTSQLGNRHGYMVNKLSSKAALIKVNDQENLNSKQSDNNQNISKKQQKQVQNDQDQGQQKQNNNQQIKQPIDSQNNKKKQFDQKNNIQSNNQRCQSYDEQQEDDKIVVCSKLSTHLDDNENEDDDQDQDQDNNEQNQQIDKFDFDQEIDEKEDEDICELKDKVLSPQQMERLSNEKKNKNQQKISEDQWNQISKETLKMQEQKKSEQNKVQAIQFMDAWNQVRQMDLIQEMKQVYQEQQVKLTLFQKLFSFCSKSGGHKLNKPSLLSERDRILAFSKIKFDDQDSLHFQMIFTIYTQLASQDVCLRYGSHWEEIGFQGSDPATDIRGGGMFGILQILAFTSNHILYLNEVLQYSQHEQYNFPLSVTLMNITTYVLSMLKEGKLDDLINSEQSVISILNKIYFTTFYVFFDNYKSSKSTIANIGQLLKKVRENIQANPKKYLKIFKQKIDRFYKEKGI